MTEIEVIPGTKEASQDVKSTIDQKSLGNLVKRRHPLYTQGNLDHWNFCESCYSGDRDWFKENIHKYRKEGPESYSDRVKRAYRFNHTKEIVDLVNKYLFRGDIERNKIDAPDCVRQFWDDSNGKGVSIENFSRSVAVATSLVGRVWIVVDTNVTSRKKIKSKADEKKFKAKTYAYIVMPQDALDMSFDDFGNLNWILIRERYRDDEDPFDSDTSSNKTEFRYRLWTRTEWMLMETENNSGNSQVVRVVDGGTHGLGVVPVTWCDHLESNELYTAHGLVGDIAYIDRAVANYASNLDVIIQEQTFSQLAIPSQALRPGDDGHDKVIEFGTKEIFTYDGENGAVPFYLQPDPKQVETILSVIKNNIGEMYHTIGMAGERTKQDNAVGIDNSSGVAKAYDFERVNAMLVSKAHSLDMFERRLVKLVCAYRKVTVDDDIDLIKYPDDFDIRGLADEFDVAANLQLLEMPDELRREQAKLLMAKLFPRASEAVKAKLEAALDKWPMSIEEVANRMAVIQEATTPDESAAPKNMSNESESRANKPDSTTGIQKPSRQGQVTAKTQ